MLCAAKGVSPKGSVNIVPVPQSSLSITDEKILHRLGAEHARERAGVVISLLVSLYFSLGHTWFAQGLFPVLYSEITHGETQEILWDLTRQLCANMKSSTHSNISLAPSCFLS